MKLTCNLNGIPEIDRAGRFPCLNPTFDFAYRCPTHAIHLYDYCGRERIERETVEFNSGDLTCEPAGGLYAFESAKPGRHWCIHFHDHPDRNEQTFEIPCHYALGARSQFFRDQMQHISELFNYHTPSRSEREMFKREAAHRLKSMLLALYNFSVTRESNRSKEDTFDWNHFFSTIDDNINQPLSTSWLARKVNLTPNTLSQKFRKYYRASLTRYILKRRIDKAKTLLTDTSMTIQEIGAAIGIPDPQYFNKQFRKMVHISPSQYRKENQHYLLDPSFEISTRDGHWQR